MIIALIGNVCTGKTTLGNLLSKRLNWPLLSIDDYRRQCHANNRRAEAQAWARMKLDAERFCNCIIESTGLSGRIYDVYRANGTPRKTVKLTADIETLKARYADRTDHPPHPYTRQPLEHMQQELNDKRADLVIDTGNVDVSQCADMIVDNALTYYKDGQQYDYIL